MSNLQISLSQISFIEKKYLKKLEQLGIETGRVFLYFFPSRYDDFSKTAKINDLKVGETATIEAKIITIQNIRTWKKRMAITAALAEDKTGSVRVVWFNQPFLTRNIQKEKTYRFSGKLQLDSNGLYISSPSYELASRTPTNTGRLVPIYPETRGITSKWLRWKISQLLKKYLHEIPEVIPNAILKRQNLIGAQAAIRELHFPSSFEKVKEAQKRMAFEEMFLIQMISVRARKDWENSRAVPVDFSEKLVKDFVASLPFTLTDAQRKSSYQILKDIENPHPM